MEKRAVLTGLGAAYLEKEALSKDLLMAAGGAGAAAAALLGAHLLRKSYGRDFREKLKTIPPVGPSLVLKLKREAGLSEMPTFENPALPNALYLPGNILSRSERKDLQSAAFRARKQGDTRTMETAKQIMAINDSPVGGVIYGTEFKNPYVLAHEFGHALSKNEPALKRAVEKSPKLLNKLFNLGMVAGGIAGVAKPEWLPGIGVGLAGLGALSTAADVYSESKATGRGLDLLKKVDFPVESEGEEALQSAGKTYSWPGVTAKVLAPLAAAGAAKLIQSWKP